MKVAVVVSGQSRVWRAYPNLVENFIAPHKADVYVATWDEPPYHEKLLAAVKPKASIIHPPGKYVEVKHEFWARYSSLIESVKERSRRKDILDGRWGFYIGLDDNGVDKWRRFTVDNTLRQAFLMSEVIKLVPEGYDYIIRCRPDSKAKSAIHLSEMKDNEVGGPVNHYYINARNPIWSHCSDQVLIGKPVIMNKVMRMWDHLPEFVREVEDSIHSTLSLNWLHPEQSLWRYIERCGGKPVPLNILCHLAKPSAQYGDNFWSRTSGTSKPVVLND